MLNQYVFIRRFKVDDERTPGGVIKPEIAQQRSNEGEVVFSEEQDIPAGSIVLFTKYGGSEVDVNGEKLVLVHRKQVYYKRLPVETPIRVI